MRTESFTRPARHGCYLAATLLITLFASLTASSAGPSLLIDVAPSFEDGQWIAQAVLTNRGPSPIELQEVFLPWGGRYSITMTAVEAKRPNTQLKMAFPIDDPVGGRIRLTPGASVRGQIQLNDFFENLTEALSRGDVVVHWSYVPMTSDGQRSDRLFGGFVIPRK